MSHSVRRLVGANENAVSVGAVVSWFDETPSVVWNPSAVRSLVRRMLLFPTTSVSAT